MSSIILDDQINNYKEMYLIRRFEESLLELFSKGLLHGTTHTSIGQEACAVGVIGSLNKEIDIVFSNHRCHGHYLAYTWDILGLYAEIIGLPSGICGGVGGSQHLHKRNFYSNGIQGGIVPAATGMAYAEKLKETGAIVVCFIGDGTMGQGVVYESLNMAALWSLPILFVLENNQYAQSTHISLSKAGSFKDRAKSFSITTQEIDVSDVSVVYDVSNKMIKDIRKDSKPGFLILNTYRLGPHSKGDDFRSKDEILIYSARDPLIKLRDYLINNEIEVKIYEEKIDNVISTQMNLVLNEHSIFIKKSNSEVKR